VNEGFKVLIIESLYSWFRANTQVYILFARGYKHKAVGCACLMPTAYSV